MKTYVAVFLAGAAALAAAAPATAQSGPFDWSGGMQQGAWLKVYSPNGTVNVQAASGRTARVHGEVRDHDRDREPVRFEVVKDGANVVVCAITERQECTADGIETVEHGWRDRHGPERVAFTVELPAGVHVTAVSGNGDVSVQGATAQVRATSGNGDIEVLGSGDEVHVSTGNGRVTIRDAGGPVRARSGNGRLEIASARGPVDASTGNGAIDVAMDALGDGDMRFATGNGKVTLVLPDDLNADLRTHLGHGYLETDFPMALSGRTDFRDFHATIGKGGRLIEVSSGNGDLVLHRR
ncbi:MAG TPA: DUF4097 family beta strand repeat-containing protein [Longimicrobiales bacterium]|nr:DUF4097 family beta strand repeat-containing protein [Longimicrobiales bacterium]